MKERGIIFNADMVRAILDGRKTQTRRIVKLPIWAADAKKVTWGCIGGKGFGFIFGDTLLRCPYGVAGDRLWVRETWQYARGGVRYRSGSGITTTRPWKPSIHMKREYSRITLEITKVRVERLQEISANDVKAEGITEAWPIGDQMSIRSDAYQFRNQYAHLWDSLHGKGAWEANPWVWVLEFKRDE